MSYLPQLPPADLVGMTDIHDLFLLSGTVNCSDDRNGLSDSDNNRNWHDYLLFIFPPD